MAYAMIGAQARPKKEYIATAPFHTSIYSYTTTQPTAAALQTTGKLQLLSVTNTGVTAAVCPAGRILRELGTRLYPGVHPGLQSGETNYFAGATHIWTKVYDAVTGFSGYIDANAPIFATYSNERPEEFVDLGETDGTGRRGPSVYTSGNITTGGQLGLTGGTKAITYVVTTSPYAFGTAANLGPFYSFAAAAAVAVTATSVPPSGTTLTIFYSGAFTTTPSTGFVGATVTPAGTQCIAVSYVSNGTVLIEYARSGALPTVPTFP